MSASILDYGLVSIVIPTYNAETFLSETIDTVLAQTYQHWELLIIDDCSTDGSLAVAARYHKKDPRIKVVQLDFNRGGPAGPRNVGVSRTEGNWVAFLDSDDIWHPRKLEMQMKIMSETGSLFSCTQMKDFTMRQENEFDDIDCSRLENINFRKQQIKGRIPASSVVVARLLAEQHPFNEEPGYKAVEDYHCWLRILDSGTECVKLSCKLLFYRKVAGQISGSKLYMLRKVFMVHKEYPGNSVFYALLLSFSHLLGAIYYRCVARRL